MKRIFCFLLIWTSLAMAFYQPVVFYQIRYEKAIDVITIDMADIRSKESIQYAAEKMDSLSKEGIFLEIDTGVHKQSMTFKDQLIEITLTIYPPTGSGYGGGVSTAQIQIAVNKKEIVDIPFGYRPKWDNLFVERILITGDLQFRIIARAGMTSTELPGLVCLPLHRDTIIDNKYLDILIEKNKKVTK